MLIRSRVVMALVVAGCGLTAMSVPSVALAHHGRGRFDRFGPRAGFGGKGAQGLCAEAGVAMNGHLNGPGGPWGGHSNWDGQGLASLTETQTKELKSACEKLATAYAAKRTADGAAAKTLWEALKADATKLHEACPALAEHHEPGFELSAACKEALTSFWTSAKEAKKAYRAAVEAADKAFAPALAEFETATAAIVAALTPPPRAGTSTDPAAGSAATTPPGRAPAGLTRARATAGRAATAGRRSNPRNSPSTPHPQGRAPRRRGPSLARTPSGRRPTSVLSALRGSDLQPILPAKDFTAKTEKGKLAVRRGRKARGLSKGR